MLQIKRSFKIEKEKSFADDTLKKTDLDSTAIVEYLETVRSEYEIERNKKQSFEDRAGLIITLLGAICIFLFEKVQIKDIISQMTMSLTFIDFIKVISGLAVYICFGFTLFMVVLVINVKQYNNFEVKHIDEMLLKQMRLAALAKIIFTYRDIIMQHRELNEKKAEAFRKSVYGVFATLVSIIIYISVI